MHSFCKSGYEKHLAASACPDARHGSISERPGGTHRCAAQVWPATTTTVSVTFLDREYLRPAHLSLQNAAAIGELAVSCQPDSSICRDFGSGPA